MTLPATSHYNTVKLTTDSYHAEFSSGGFQVSLTKKSSDNVFFFFFFLVLSLFYRSQMVNFKDIYHFSRFQGGSNIFQGGPTFSRGGPKCLFPIETHITCDFPGGGSGPPVPPPPPDPHFTVWEKLANLW